MKTSPCITPLCVLAVSVLFACEEPTENEVTQSNLHNTFNAPRRFAARMITEGRNTFRHDTFGNEAFWGDTLRLHQAIAGEANGGVGPGVSPQTALALGLKVDVRALPNSLRRALRRGQVDLSAPATTLALLKENAVVGLTGFFNAQDQLESVGVQCALCHSTVDDVFAPGIGRRLDGWPNRDLDIGTIISIAPDLSVVTEVLDVDDASLRAVLRSWGPGKFDAHVFLDGLATRPDGAPAAVLIPAAYGLLGVDLATYNGWGSLTYWNALVANLEMHGMGTFVDARLADAQRFPVAAAAGLNDVRNTPDQVTSKLGALQFYQLALEAPTAPSDRYNPAAAARGEALFNGDAQCATCHVPPLYTEPGHNLHAPEDIGIDAFQAQRGPTGKYRTTPLRGLFTRESGGFYHDGRFGTLSEVIEHYDETFDLHLPDSEKADLLEFLRSL